MYAKFLALLVVVGQVVNQKLSAAWAFQHKVVAFGKKSYDTDKGDELEAAFSAMGNKLFKSFWGKKSTAGMFTVKTHIALAGIARGAFKSSDFTDDKEIQVFLTELSKLADKQFKYSKISDTVTTTRTRKSGNGEKKVVTIK